jgi:peptidoglycan/LPS O-acetylase OafA/YrhL
VGPRVRAAVVHASRGRREAALPAYLGILVLILLFAPGVALSVLGVMGLRRRGDPLKKALSAVALVVGIALIAILVVAVLGHFTPWRLLIAVSAGGLGVAGFIFWVTVLADCLLNETREGNERLVWMLAIILTLVVGALLYYILRRPRRVAELGR